MCVCLYDSSVTRGRGGGWFQLPRVGALPNAHDVRIDFVAEGVHDKATPALSNRVPKAHKKENVKIRTNKSNIHLLSRCDIDTLKKLMLFSFCLAFR